MSATAAAGLCDQKCCYATGDLLLPADYSRHDVAINDGASAYLKKADRCRDEKTDACSGHGVVADPWVLCV